jgi:hypothetical protein
MLLRKLVLDVEVHVIAVKRLKEDARFCRLQEFYIV